MFEVFLRIFDFNFSSSACVQLDSVLCFTAVFFAIMCIDADVRLARRIRRDTVERGRDINSVLEQVIFFL